MNEPDRQPVVYRCLKCDAVVRVVAGQILARPCGGCAEPVSADLKAVAYGVSSTAG